MDYVSLKGAGHFMIRRVRLWNALATGFILNAFGEASGADVAGATKTLHRILPAAGTRIPVVL